MNIDLNHNELQTLQGCLESRIKVLLSVKQKKDSIPTFDTKKHDAKIKTVVKLYNKISFSLMEESLDKENSDFILLTKEDE